MKRWPWLGALVLFFFATPALAEGDLDFLFSKGHKQLSAGLGYGSFDNKDYLIVGMGGGYYLLDGLETGLDTEAWLGSSPQIYAISPQVRYFLLHVASVKPYVGAFYRRTFYSHAISPIDSTGARTGLVFPFTDRSFATAGIVYEHYYHCDTTRYDSCDIVYPELGLAFSF